MAEPVVHREEEEFQRRFVAAVLRAGVAASAALLLTGLLLWIAAGRPEARPIPGGWPLASPEGWGAWGWCLAVGLALLLATPVLRVLSLALVYARLRERFFAAVSFGVLALLLFSAAASWF